MAKYTKPDLRDRIKDEIKASDKGGKKGQWSARKSQLLTQEYEKRGGGYVGAKDKRQRSLEKWQDEEWQTADGSARARRGSGETTRYLPKEAWEQLSDKEKKATDAKKRKGSTSGAQYVGNTKAAKGARTIGRLDGLTVPEAVKRARELDKRQLKKAIEHERGGKARKTLLTRLEAELSRR